MYIVVGGRQKVRVGQEVREMEKGKEREWEWRERERERERRHSDAQRQVLWDRWY